MKTQAEIQDSTLAATKTAAEAAKNSADMLPKIERAYVFLEGDIKHDIRTLRHDETERGFNICFTMKNYGKTPAIVGSTWKKARYISGADPHELSEELVPIVPELVLASDNTKEIELFLVITGEEYLRALDSIGRIFLVSKIIYEDIFGNPHETGFCFQFDAVMGQWRVFSDNSLNYRT